MAPLERARLRPLQALRRADRLWVPIEEAPNRADGAHVVVVMVGDTLSRLSANYYAPCMHRVVAPPAGHRIGTPFLFRGRSDAVLNTRPLLESAKVSMRASKGGWGGAEFEQLMGWWSGGLA